MGTRNRVGASQVKTECRIESPIAHKRLESTFHLVHVHVPSLSLSLSPSLSLSLSLFLSVEIVLLKESIPARNQFNGGINSSWGINF